MYQIFVSSGDDDDYDDVIEVDDDDDDDKIELATEAEKRVKTGSVIVKEVLLSDIFKTILQQIRVL